MNKKLTVTAIGIAAIVLAAVSHAESARDILKASGVKGGLVLHLPCGDGRLTAALGSSDSYLVLGLDADAGKVEAARSHIRSRGIYGRVSADRLIGGRLPCADNLANLVVVSDPASGVAKDEILRALAPNGVAMVKGTSVSGWTTFTKPWPAEIDEWTHYLHGPDGNQVAADTVVGPPQRVKWLAKPYWGRSHRYGNQTAMVSAQGRLFYVGNDVEPSIEVLPDRPYLIARDAFNGVLLWKHPIFVDSVADRLVSPDKPEDFFLFEPKFPMELKVVAVDDKLYLAFGRDGEIQALDAATGKLLKTYAGTKHTEEILYYEGTLLTVVAEDADELRRRPRNMADLNDATFSRKRAKMIRALHADSGKRLWEENLESSGGLQTSPVINKKRVFAVVGDDLIRLDLASGERIWSQSLPTDEAGKKKELSSVYYTKGPAIYDHLIATDDVVLLATKEENTALQAFSAEKGEHLWSYACASPQRAGAAAFVVGDQVWVNELDSKKNKPLVALDLKTGKIQKQIDTTPTFDVGHHHRCYGNRATEQFILFGRRGVEFVDLESGKNWLHHWVRGKCRFGVLPCNGLMYASPHNCSCYPYSTFKGYSALAAGSVPMTDDAPRLERGPAYEEVKSSELKVESSEDWPTHRHDAERSGTTPNEVVSKNLQRVWQTSLDATPSALTAAADRLFVCTPDTHQVHALDINSGEKIWTFTAGARVDSPPTLYKNLALFGASDGYVYCINSKDGELVWRFRAAPADLRIVAYGQLESLWPVHGSVLVKNDKVYCSAGRSSLLDGGITVYALDPETGNVLAQHVIHHPYDVAEPAMLDNDGHPFDGDLAVLQDLLVGDGDGLALKQIRLDANCVPTGKTGVIIANNGLLNSSWFSRIGWYFGKPTAETRKSNADRDDYDIFESGRQGRYLIFDDATTYSVRVYPNIGKFRQSFVPGGKGYQIFADDNESFANKWNIFTPIRVEAMVATGGNTLYMAGSPDAVDETDPWGAIEGRQGGLLWAVSADTGSKLAELAMDSPPVVDGIIAAKGRLFISLKNGSVVCLEGQKE